MISSTSRLAILAAMTLAAPVATAIAQEAESGVIDQVQFGDVFSNMDVYVPGYTYEAVSASTAVGNLAAAVRESGDVEAEIRQEFEAVTTANSQLRGSYADAAMAATTSYGNASSGGTNYGYNAYHAEQYASGDVNAFSEIELLGGNQVSSATSAVANVSATENNFGTNIADQTQYSNANVNAATDADMAENGYVASFVTAAGGNASSSTGYTSSNYNRALQKTESGTAIRGTTDVYMNDGTNVTGATTAFGNSASVENQWGYATLGLDGAETKQENNAEIDAQSWVTLDHWSGMANSSSYGVGNSALISNVGSDTALYADQENSGTVGAQASLSGQSFTGGTGNVTATAIGNAATATVCNFCSDGAVSGRVNQTNDGYVYANGSANTPNAGAVYGAATAIGNSATFQSTGD